MLILAFETSAKACSVAVHDGQKLLGESFQNTGLTHSQTLMTMAEDLLENCGKAASDVTHLAVAAGPGSFTGVRIGVAAAKGWAWGAELPVYGVSTLESMALSLGAWNGHVCACMDARRNQVYNAIFLADSGKLERVSEDRAISLEEAAADLREVDGPLIIVGDGAQLTYDYFTRAGIECSLAPAHLRQQNAVGVALAAEAAGCDAVVSAQDLAPNYLRLSQAERERLERMKTEA